jgi:excinuclease ABC subunit C
MNNEILNKIKILPEKPGVYIHKDITGDIIYIGKARVLKNRVRSYFLKSNIFDAKTDALVSNISSFEFIVTKTESEALLLENELIKKYNLN